VGAALVIHRSEECTVYTSMPYMRLLLRRVVGWVILWLISTLHEIALVPNAVSQSVLVLSDTH
jgi:hypothetical protein